MYILHGGKLIPSGKNSELLMSRGDSKKGLKMLRNGEFVRYTSENNAARAHQLISGFGDGCYISTSTDIEVAIDYATDHGKSNGYVYVLDRELLEIYGAVFKEFPNPRYPLEKEVSIRAADNGEIPQETIVRVMRVMAGENELISHNSKS